MMELRYSDEAIHDLKRLPREVAARIVAKMRWFSEKDDPMKFAKKLSGTFEGYSRFRIGDYRIVCSVLDGIVRILHVLAVRHRKNVYRTVR